jgi:hypothetical protein
MPVGKEHEMTLLAKGLKLEEIEILCANTIIVYDPISYIRDTLAKYKYRKWKVNSNRDR